ncbi:cupin [Flaviflexus equikiangi]|uniref:cupin n=1 Tax=Flaviflexus equikiangi TaxID=2758573 RepID=UPI001C71506B|nr:cupin [Flaviflexus equikiangi]
MMIDIEDLLTRARAAKNGRLAEAVVHDGPLRQTVVALAAGTELAPHNAPIAESILVLAGSLEVVGSELLPASAVELVSLAHERHGVRASEDCVFLLTTVARDSM